MRDKRDKRGECGTINYINNNIRERKEDELGGDGGSAPITLNHPYSSHIGHNVLYRANIISLSSPKATTKNIVSNRCLVKASQLVVSPTHIRVNRQNNVAIKAA